jgi:DNA polymerase V
MFALADANNFYASCETVFRPDLRGKPVVVVSNNDGCVIARSAEAKRMGIKMAAPLFQNERFFKQNGVQVFSSNYELYGDISSRMMAILGEMAAGQRRETGLVIGVGFGPTKTLAKLANHAAKKWTQTRGVVDLSDQSRQRKLLHLTDVSDIWGIGRRISLRLNQLGITTALQLADSNISMIRKNFDVITERTVRELNGASCLALEDAPPPKQQIVNSRSFGQRITLLEEMQQAVVLYAIRAAEKLREQNSRCRHISVSIATARHGDEPQYSNTASRIYDYPTNDTRDIIESAIRGLGTIWREGYRYAKAGVMLGDFYQSGVAQFDMFSEQQPRANADALMAALDTINRSGKGKVWFAGQVERDSAWQMKREMLSPRYTTRLKDIPVNSI